MYNQNSIRSHNLTFNRNLIRVALLLVTLSVVAPPMFAAPVYTTSVAVPYDPNAPSSNFDAPSLGSNTTAYVVRTGSDANNLYIDISATNPNTDISGLQFANIYLGGPTFSGLIFEVTNDRVSTYDDPSNYFSLAGTGFTFDAQTNDISFSLPFSFLENDPLNIGFSQVNPGDLLRVSYSQSFGYSFVGGSDNYPLVTRLGGQIVPVPEPSCLAMLGVGALALGFMIRRHSRAV